MKFTNKCYILVRFLRSGIFVPAIRPTQKNIRDRSFMYSRRICSVFRNAPTPVFCFLFFSRRYARCAGSRRNLRTWGGGPSCSDASRRPPASSTKTRSGHGTSADPSRRRLLLDSPRLALIHTLSVSCCFICHGLRQENGNLLCISGVGRAGGRLVFCFVFWEGGVFVGELFYASKRSAPMCLSCLM